MYLPKSKYKTATAKPGEYVDSTGQQYVGPIIETFTGACYPGTDPMTMGPELTKVGLEKQTPVELGFYNIKRVPTEAEYRAGSMIRYFVQTKRTQKIIELSPESWRKNFVKDDPLRTWQAAEWILTGPRAEVNIRNGEVLDAMEKIMPGIVSSKVLFDPLQFYRTKAELGLQ